MIRVLGIKSGLTCLVRGVEWRPLELPDLKDTEESGILMRGG